MPFSRSHQQMPEWAIPMTYAIIAVVAGLTLPRIENASKGWLEPAVTAPVALALLSSITAGMIALTGIVFSLAFVMVQFSATAYSPRLVLWVSRDPVIWHAIGVFTATFLYGIGMMAGVDRNGSGRVPFFGGWLVVALMLASVAMFIALIRRIGMLQVDQMLAFTGELGRQAIDRTYPPLETPMAMVPSRELTNLPIVQTVAYSGTPRVLQAIDQTSVLARAIEAGGCVEVMVSVGDTLIAGITLLRVFGGKQLLPDEAWIDAFELGGDRTFAQDPKYALRLLVDIAIKALSPGINDPTTAVQALDQIQDHLLRLGRRRLEIGATPDEQGRLRLLIPYPTWDDFLQLGLEEIRMCGASSVQVMRRMQALLADLIAALPAERHYGLEHQLERLNATVARAFPDSEDRLEASQRDRQGLGAAQTDRLERRTAREAGRSSKY